MMLVVPLAALPAPATAQAQSYPIADQPQHLPSPAPGRFVGPSGATVDRWAARDPYAMPSGEKYPAPTRPVGAAYGPNASNGPAYVAPNPLPPPPAGQQVDPLELSPRWARPGDARLVAYDQPQGDSPAPTAVRRPVVEPASPPSPLTETAGGPTASNDSNRGRLPLRPSRFTLLGASKPGVRMASFPDVASALPTSAAAPSDDEAIGPYGCNPCAGCLPRGGGSGWSVVAGAEYLLVRPHFSEPRAFNLRTVQMVGADLISTEQSVPFEYDYRSNFRTYVALRNEACCEELRLTYWNLDGSSSASAAAEAITGGSISPGIWEAVTVTPGDTVSATNNVHGQVWDATLSKCICTPECCDPCNPCRRCPPWRVSWSLGIRGADMGYDTVVQTMTTAPGEVRVDASMNFAGAGPIVGLDFDRAVGPCRVLSLYAKWNAALLLGDYSQDLVRTASMPTGDAVTRFTADYLRVIPVTEIEIGGRWRPSDRLELSAGWFFQAWWDLGMTEDFASTLDLLNFVRDDANIMAWEGLTLRAEWRF